MAFLDGKNYDEPAFFRLDRIHSFKPLDEYYSCRAHDGCRREEAHNAIPFTFTGKGQRVTLKCHRRALEALRDRLPGSRITAEGKEDCTLQGDVYSGGFLHWVTTLGDDVEILEPEELRAAMRQKLEAMLRLYK